MKAWTLRIALALCVVLAGAYYWFLIESPSPAPFSIDLPQIRRLAASIPGERPREIHVEHLADFKGPAAIMITGGGWPRETMWAVSYQLVYASHTAIIDTAMSQQQGQAMGSAVTAFYAEPFQRMIKAMSRAALILITHEHLDHIGGLIAHPELGQLLRMSALLTREQLSDPARALPGRFPDAALKEYRPLMYDRLHPAAPGIVLIKSAGHSPGSQMVYVQLDSGAEFLFLGDVAWIRRNVDLVKGRPRLIANLIHEDREAVLGQLAALNALAASEPKLTLIPGHDAEIIKTLIAEGRVKDGF